MRNDASDLGALSTGMKSFGGSKWLYQVLPNRGVCISISAVKSSKPAFDTMVGARTSNGFWNQRIYMTEAHAAWTRVWISRGDSG